MVIKNRDGATLKNRPKPGAQQRKGTRHATATTFAGSTPSRSGHRQPLRTTLIGASNIRDMSKRLQTDHCNATAIYSPGIPLQEMAPRVKHTVSHNTDVAIVHLGTNNALDKDSHGQCMLKSDDAIRRIDKERTESHPEVPLVFCSVPPTRKRPVQRRVDMLDALLRRRCQQNPTIHFLDTQLTVNDTGRDGIHLTATGKDRLAHAINTYVQGFHPLRYVTHL